MSKSNTNLADQYDMSHLEPDVDPEKAAAFLQVDQQKPEPSTPTAVESVAKLQPKSKPRKKAASTDAPAKYVGATSNRNKRTVWTSRTIRLRQETADTLTKAACGQKTKLVEGKLKGDDPVTVQEIAERGIRLALADLGYIK